MMSCKQTFHIALSMMAAFGFSSELIGAQGAEFEIFDGRRYNGKYYPRVDIIEWGQPSHMEFQVYWKGHPVDMAFQLETKTGKNVLLVNYILRERGERLCRRVVAPGHFGKKLFIYRDSSDHEMDNTIVSGVALEPDDLHPGLKSVESPLEYVSCEESPQSTNPEPQPTPKKSEPPASGRSPTGNPPAPSFEGW